MPAKKSAKKATTKKAAAKKVSAKKTVAKKAITKKTTAKKVAKKSVTKKSTPVAGKKPGTIAKPTTDAIARQAYLNYLHRIENSLPGNAEQDWVEAERMLVQGKA